VPVHSVRHVPTRRASVARRQQPVKVVIKGPNGYARIPGIRTKKENDEPAQTVVRRLVAHRRRREGRGRLSGSVDRPMTYHPRRREHYPRELRKPLSRATAIARPPSVGREHAVSARSQCCSVAAPRTDLDAERSAYTSQVSVEIQTAVEKSRSSTTFPNPRNIANTTLPTRRPNQFVKRAPSHLDKGAFNHGITKPDIRDVRSGNLSCKPLMDRMRKSDRHRLGLRPNEIRIAEIVHTIYIAQTSYLCTTRRHPGRGPLTVLPSILHVSQWCNHPSSSRSFLLGLCC